MISTLKMLFMTSRPVSWINTAFPFTAAYLLIGGTVDPLLIVGTLFFLIPYNLLMYGVNDVYDYDSDIRNPRKGGVEGAITPKKYHRTILLAAYGGCIPFVIYLLSQGAGVSALVLFTVMFFVIAYSAKGLRFKEVPILDSITSSIHFVGPMVYAFTFFEVGFVGWMLALAFFLWGCASHALGAIQDIIPDREANISSIATVFGARITVWIVFILYTASVAIVGLQGEWYYYVVAGSLLLYVINVARFLGVTDKTSADTRRGWRAFMKLNYIVGTVVTMVCIAVITNTLA